MVQAKVSSDEELKEQPEWAKVVSERHRLS
jgi:hypothetical protein